MNQPANTTKAKWPRAAAIEVARELCAILEPVTERLIVAGSLRRRKAEVGDVEILFVPKVEKQKVDLLRVAFVSLADMAIDRMLRDGTLAKRQSKIGTVAWGDKNKLAVHRSGVPVDLFVADAACWYNYLVCRTGPADSNTRIATRAQMKGYKWNPYGRGFTHLGTGTVVPMESEEAVFEFVGLPYLPPHERQ